MPDLRHGQPPHPDPPRRTFSAEEAEQWELARLVSAPLSACPYGSRFAHDDPAHPWFCDLFGGVLTMAEGTGSEPRRMTAWFNRATGDQWPSFGDPPRDEQWRWEQVEYAEVGSGHDEQTEGLLAVANQAGVSIHNANGPVLRMTLDEAVKLRDDFERALAVHGLGTVAAVVEALREADPSDTSTLMFTSGFRYAINVIEERFGSSVSGGE